MEIILASASLGRKKVLQRLGLKFKAIPANIDETQFTTSNHITTVKKIAKAKALAVLEKIKSARGARPIFEERKGMFFVPEKLLAGDLTAPIYCLIIAADSMVVFAGKTYGKPKTKSEARKYLRLFSGRTHQFLTGLCLVNTKTNKVYQEWAETRVTFARLSAKEIYNYVTAAPVTRFAGAYSFSQIIRPKITLVGSESNVLGLPIEKLIPILKKEGVSIPKSPKE